MKEDLKCIEISLKYVLISYFMILWISVQNMLMVYTVWTRLEERPLKEFLPINILIQI